MWMNSFKAIVSTPFFLLTALFLGGPLVLNSGEMGLVLLSGAIGLGIGDLALLEGFRKLGPGRTLVLFGFQPIVLGFLSFLILGQRTSGEQSLGIFFFVACLMILAHESWRKTGEYQIVPLLIALLGMVLDSVGVILVRSVFDANPDFNSMTMAFWRCIGAIAFFTLWGCVRPIYLWQLFRKQSGPAKLTVILGSLLGTYLALGLYTAAVKSGNLASVSGIAITGTLFSSLFECIVNKEWPSKHMILAFLAFCVGIFFIS